MQAVLFQLGFFTVIALTKLDLHSFHCDGIKNSFQFLFPFPPGFKLTYGTKLRRLSFCNRYKGLISTEKISVNSLYFQNINGDWGEK